MGASPLHRPESTGKVLQGTTSGGGGWEVEFNAWMYASLPAPPHTTVGMEYRVTYLIQDIRYLIQDIGQFSNKCWTGSQQQLTYDSPEFYLAYSEGSAVQMGLFTSCQWI